MWGAAGPRWADLCCATGEEEGREGEDWEGEDWEGEDGEGDGDEDQWRRKGCKYASCFCCAGDCSFVWMEAPEA